MPTIAARYPIPGKEAQDDGHDTSNSNHGNGGSSSNGGGNQGNGNQDNGNQGDRPDEYKSGPSHKSSYGYGLFKSVKSGYSQKSADQYKSIMAAMHKSPYNRYPYGLMQPPHKIFMMPPPSNTTHNWNGGKHHSNKNNNHNNGNSVNKPKATTRKYPQTTPKQPPTTTPNWSTSTTTTAAPTVTRSGQGNQGNTDDPSRMGTGDGPPEGGYNAEYWQSIIRIMRVRAHSTRIYLFTVIYIAHFP